MIHYHGLPITPATSARKAVDAGHAFVSHAHPGRLGVAMDVCQSFAIDNGAFSAWKKGTPVTDWREFYDWPAACQMVPSCDFAVVPDVIDGSEADTATIAPITRASTLRRTPQSPTAWPLSPRLA